MGIIPLGLVGYGLYKGKMLYVGIGIVALMLMAGSGTGFGFFGNTGSGADTSGGNITGGIGSTGLGLLSTTGSNDTGVMGI